MVSSSTGTTPVLRGNECRARTRLVLACQVVRHLRNDRTLQKRDHALKLGFDDRQEKTASLCSTAARLQFHPTQNSVRKSRRLRIALKHTFVDCQVRFFHFSGGKALLEAIPHVPTIEACDVVYGAHGTVDILYYKAADSIFHHLRYGPAVEGNHGSAASHSFDHY